MLFAYFLHVFSFAIAMNLLYIGKKARVGFTAIEKCKVVFRVRFQALNQRPANKHSSTEYQYFFHESEVLNPKSALLSHLAEIVSWLKTPPSNQQEMVQLGK